MIQIDDSGRPWRDHLRDEIETMASLLDDLQRLVSGVFPTHGELATAPLLVNPQIGVAPEACLKGMAVGHPVLGTRPVCTSACVIYAPSAGWARTWSRLYRLEWHQ